jgi:hypothetical protein
MGGEPSLGVVLADGDADQVILHHRLADETAALAVLPGEPEVGRSDVGEHGIDPPGR